MIASVPAESASDLGGIPVPEKIRIGTASEPPATVVSLGTLSGERGWTRAERTLRYDRTPGSESRYSLNDGRPRVTGS